MIRWCKALVALAMVAAVGACAEQSRINSRAYPVATKPQRVLVVQSTFYTVPKPKESNPFKDEFSRLTAACGIETAFAVNNDSAGKSLFAAGTVSPTADVESEKIEHLKPDYAFTLQERTYGSSGIKIREVTFDAVLTQLDPRKEAWRSDVYIKMTLVNGQTMADVAKLIVARLRQDGVLTSCAREKGEGG